MLVCLGGWRIWLKLDIGQHSHGPVMEDRVWAGIAAMTATIVVCSRGSHLAGRIAHRGRICLESRWMSGAWRIP